MVIARKILRRDQLPTAAPGEPSLHSAPVTVVEGKAPVDFSRSPEAQGPEINAAGHVNLNEMLSDRTAAASPFGDQTTFPLDPDSLNYYHPDKK